MLFREPYLKGCTGKGGCKRFARSISDGGRITGIESRSDVVGNRFLSLCQSSPNLTSSFIGNAMSLWPQRATKY